MSPKLLRQLRVAMLVVMLSAVLLLAVLICTIIFGNRPGRMSEYLAGTFFSLAAFAFGALLCVNVLCRTRDDTLAWIGFVGSAVSFLFWQPVGIGESFRVNYGVSLYPFYIAATCATVITGWCVLYSLFKAFTRVNTAAIVTMYITLSLGAVIAVMSCYGVIVDPWNDIFRGTLALFCLLAGCGVVTFLSLALISSVRSTGTGETISSKIVLELVCPRCQMSQSLRAGLSRCTSCGLRMEINVEEPVCECGYQLYQLTTDRCPECGREIPHEDRWGVHAPGSDAPNESGLHQDGDVNPPSL